MSQVAKDILINKAISLFNEGNVKKSLKEALVAKKKYPNEPFIFNLLGVLYAQMESYSDSIKNYSKAIKLNPKYFEAPDKNQKKLLLITAAYIEGIRLIDNMEVIK